MKTFKQISGTDIPQKNGVINGYTEEEAAFSDEGLPEPKYESIAFMLKATIWNGIKSNEPINELLKEETSLKNHAVNILNLLKQNPKLSQSTIAGLLNLSDSTIKRCFNFLKENYYITWIPGFYNDNV